MIANRLHAVARLTWFLLLLTSSANAIEDNSREPSLRERKAAAEVLFEEGKDLVRKGDLAAACIKFEESQALDTGLGTQFNLADCYERLGRLASAYAMFMEVAATTRQRGQLEREALARQRANSLKPRLSRLVITIDGNDVPPGLSIARNGTPVGAAQWGVPIPVDPGQVRVTVTAPDRVAWEVVVNIESEGQSEQVVIPNLQPASSTSSVAVHVRGGHPSGTPFLDQTKNRIALGLVGLGAVGVGLFTYFGLKSESKYRATDASCDSNDRCDASALATRKSAYQAGVNANISLAAGTACLLAGGLLMLLHEPQPQEHALPGRVRATPVVTSNTYGAMVQGVF